MNIILIRHGEPDYSHIKKEDSTILPTKAGLSSNGINQAKSIYKKEIFKDSEIILCSPFQRTLETAKYLNESLNLPLFIENDLHEWLPDKEYKMTIKDLKNLYKDYKSKRGIRTTGSEIWESDEDVKKRVSKCLEKYKNYENIVIVGHSRLFKIFFGLKDCDYCSIHIVEYS